MPADKNFRLAKFRIASSILALFFASAVPGGAPAGPAKAKQPPESTGRNVIITLQDHSTLFGRIVSMKSGALRLRTPALGILNIPVRSIRSIRFNAGKRKSGNSAVPADSAAQTRRRPPAASTPLPSQNILGIEFGKLMQGIMGNAALMRQISQIQNDPEIRSVIQDPAVVRAVQNGDILSLMKNPKVLRLLNNDKLRKLSREALKDR